MLSKAKSLPTRARKKSISAPTPPRHFWPTSFEADPGKIPGKIIDKIKFNKPDAVFATHKVEIKGIKSGRLVCEVIGNDPQLVIKGNWGELKKIKGIALKLKYTGTSLFLDNSSTLEFELGADGISAIKR